MRLVVDTNVLLSALLSGRSLAARLLDLWEDGWCEVLTAREQFDELARATRYPRIRERLAPHLAGRLVNRLRDVATIVPGPLSHVARSADPDDDWLLALAEAGRADFLVTGDRRSGLLALRGHAGVRIVTVREVLEMHRKLPGD